jgi:ABC-type antimicrobial peptide transport system permease subunit
MVPTLVNVKIVMKNIVMVVVVIIYVYLDVTQEKKEIQILTEIELVAIVELLYAEIM